MTFKGRAHTVFGVTYKKVFTHKAGAVLAERGLDIRSLSKRVDETHLAVKQRAGFHKVVYHLFPADLPVSVRGSRER